MRERETSLIFALPQTPCAGSARIVSQDRCPPPARHEAPGENIFRLSIVGVVFGQRETDEKARLRSSHRFRRPSPRRDPGGTAGVVVDAFNVFQRLMDSYAGRGRAVGVGPNGAAAVRAGFGPNGHGARAIATNGETTRTWSRFVHS